MSAYATAKFLIYSKFESQMPPELSKSTIAGSIIVDSADSEEEAKEKVRVYEQRSAACAVSRGHSSYIYIANDPNWWK